MNRLKRHAAAWSLALSALLPMTAGAAAGDPLGPEFALGGNGVDSEWLRSLRWSDDGQLLAVVSGTPTQVRRLGPDGQLLSSHTVEEGCAYALDGAGGVIRATVTNATRGVVQFVQVYWPDGSPRTGPFRADTQQNTPFVISCPSIAANAAGNFVVGWGKYSEVNLDGITLPVLDAVLTGPIGKLLHEDLKLTPLLVALLCCRIPPYLGPSAAYVRAYSPDGVPLREPRLLSFQPDLITPGQADQRVAHGTSAINHAGEFAASWVADVGELTQTVNFKRFSASGSGSSLLPKTLYLQERIARSWPMALGDDGSLYAFSSLGTPDLVVYDRFNLRRQKPVPLDDTGVPGGAVGIGLAVDPQGDVLVAWTKRSNSQPRSLRGRWFTRDGTPKGPSFLISDNNVISEGYADLVIAPMVSVSATGEFVVGWSSWAGARGRLYQGR